MHALIMKTTLLLFMNDSERGACAPREAQTKNRTVARVNVRRGESSSCAAAVTHEGIRSAVIPRSQCMRKPKCARLWRGCPPVIQRYPPKRLKTPAGLTSTRSLLLGLGSFVAEIHQRCKGAAPALPSPLRAPHLSSHVKSNTSHVRVCTMSKCELIELKDLSLNDPIELAAPSVHNTPPPVKSGQTSHHRVVRLVGDIVNIETSVHHPEEAALGHSFQPYSYTHLTWCDLCGEFIWGLYQKSLRCTNCSYTCHYRCQPFIQLKCSAPGSGSTETDTDDSIESDTNVDEQITIGLHDLTPAEIQQRVKEYNAQINNNLYMVDNKDGSFTGFIKVHFQLVRPVSLPPLPQCQGLVQGEEQQGRCMKRRTSFYLPKDSAKHLHISSETRVREVIQALLNKFTVVDNPAKFALFERTEKQSYVSMRKLSADERPLHLRLCAGPSETLLCLVLKENDTGDVNWDAFSFPELCNFLQILQREEEEHVRQIVRRYTLAKERIKQAMAQINTPG
ncbi:ras association domain-containing protein 1 isoform X4 [Oryzias latipes]|nr:ras association domain-containing protein 1 isoform X4 [Oryzias latipes]